MSIFQLKKALFPSIESNKKASKSLDKPLSFLSNRFQHYPTDHTQVGYEGVYFFSGSRQTQYEVEGILNENNINVFDKAEHSFVIQCTPTIFDKIMTCVKKAVLMAYNSGQLPLSSKICTNFDQFWLGCRKPENNRFHVEAPAWDKRRRSKKYINIYDVKNTRELTGLQLLPSHSIVLANLRFSVSETECDDGLMVGIRPLIGAGIRIIELGGDIPVIDSPWDWSNVNMETLSTPMYTSMRVKTPALRVVDLENNYATVDVKAKPLYSKAIDELHESAGAEPWDGSIEIRGPLKAHVGGVIVATVAPSRNRSEILWHTERYHASAVRQGKRGGYH